MSLPNVPRLEDVATLVAQDWIGRIPVPLIFGRCHAYEVIGLPMHKSPARVVASVRRQLRKAVLKVAGHVEAGAYGEFASGPWRSGEWRVSPFVQPLSGPTRLEGQRGLIGLVAYVAWHPLAPAKALP